MNAAVVKRTQEALGRVIRRPPLTEKLLSKPPFRYLHDIITEVIRMTGFMKGLYTDTEMKSDNVKDKDAKISFLQKAIDVVVMVTGEPLSAKPARIVAGHEPERTNELLQRIGKCCLSKVSSDDAVKRVLAGEKDGKGRASLTSKPQEPDNRNVREEEPRVPKDEEGRRNSEINEGSTSRDRKQNEELKEESKQREKERDKEKTKENDRDRHKDSERDKGREGERERTRTRARPDRDRDRGNRDRDKDLDRVRERKNEGGKEKERWKDREKERERDKGRDRDRDRRRVKNGEHARDPAKEKSREHDKPEKKSSSSGEVTKKLSDGSFKDSKAEAETEVSSRTSKSMATKTSKRRSKTSMEGPAEANTNSASVSDGNPSSLWRDNPEPEPAVKQKGDSPNVSEGEVGPVGQEKSEVPGNPEVPPELPSGARRIPRPGSARPAPPRVKRQDSAEVLTADRTGSGQTVSNVIVDLQNSENEEDDQFVVEAAPPLSEVSELETVHAVELEEDEKHGGLVKKILETKKDYEKLQLSPRPGEKERSLALESAWKKEKDIVSKEIEKLRLSIQTLCKSALPLGKIMDYLQEDADAMQNELQLWHHENQQHAEALQKEQSITDSAVEPLKVELAELEQLIKDQQDKICAVKANILKNEEKIQKMVYSINLSSRR
ncbi:TRAF3-interacting protein 1 isoform X6 [Pipistrellus kuhlii]|uniref:TRAF3-interacting protein 1 n=1 Tax=Pipistrellus kuhlii TaxID=59472 RepID=A0A7J7XWN4_PIPKU|nr:TRAF3-interacting protein 1 isoform X6 [Pipistrellus kuhlii]KAF6354082.1 TRAF3 interacting protein 1 [Pipistrellus kuhlii]